MEKTYDQEFPVSAIVNYQFVVPAESVFDAWLDLQLIGRFMFGPEVRDEQIVSLSSDARIGGRFSFIVRRKGIDVAHVGEFLEISRPHHLVFTWAIGDDSQQKSIITIDIAPSATGCILTLTQQMHAEWSGFVKQSKSAWNQMLGALAEVL